MRRPETSTPLSSCSAASLAFTLLKSLFLDLHMESHAFLRAFSLAPLISLAIELGWTLSELTSATKEEASFLESHNFDLDSAVSTFFEEALGLHLHTRIDLAFVGSRSARDSSPWDLRLRAMVV
ncbi:unnamed protein product [Lactuca saligna]|uniref:Uncharacterized protein n=1 Tax=Lactuca saligna TaxID=75948 RepID=A0AA35ZDK0_LACSI|nr:unnamed protein product [Lactuca saligna]